MEDKGRIRSNSTCRARRGVDGNASEASKNDDINVAVQYLRSNGKQWKGGEDGTEEDDVLHPFPSEEFSLTSGRFLVVQSLRAGRSVAFKISSDDPTKF